MDTSKARGVFFVFDRNGMVTAIRGYTPELALLEFTDLQPVAKPRTRTFEDVAVSFGYRDAEEFALMLRRRGMNVISDQPKRSGLSRLIGGLARS